MIEWSDLPIVIGIAEAGSYTQAARTLGISQPTVGRRIQALEARLGAPIFEREDGDLRPTAFGIVVLDHARRMQDEAAAIARAAVSQDNSLSGPVVVTASEGAGAEWLPIALKSFSDDHPNIQVVINIDNASANLAQRQADIALRWKGPGNQQSLIGRRVATVRGGFYAARSYLEARGRPKRPEDLAGHCAVEWNISAPFAWPEAIDGIEVKPDRAVMQTNSPNAVMAGIAAGYGIGVATHRMARARPAVERVLPNWETTLDLWIVVHEDVRRSARIRAAFDHLVELLEADRGYFEHGEASVLLDRADRKTPVPA